MYLALGAVCCALRCAWWWVGLSVLWSVCVLCQSAVVLVLLVLLLVVGVVFSWWVLGGLLWSCFLVVVLVSWWCPVDLLCFSCLCHRASCLGFR